MRLNLKGGKEAVWEVVAKTGFPCSHQYEEKICGRPLGMDFDRWAHLNFIISPPICCSGSQRMTGVFIFVGTGI